MQVLIICELVAIFVITIYLLHHYAAQGVSIGIKIAVFISWFICFLTIGLVPIDVYYSYTVNGDGEDTGFDSPPEILQMAWRAVYWSSFFLSWFGLPLLQEYEKAGDFSPKEKIKRSIKTNLISYAIMGVLGICFVLYLVISQKMGKEGIFQFFITFSNIFGIFLIILCLGFGLVQMPKRYLQMTNKQVNLKYYKFHLAECDEEKTSLQVELEDLIKLVHLISLRKDVELDQKVLLNTVMEQCTEDFIAKSKRSINSLDHTKANEYGDIKHDKIVALNKDVKKKIAELQRLENKYESTLKYAFLAEAVIECQTAGDWANRKNPDGVPVTMGACSRFFNWIAWFWYTKLEQLFFLFVGIFFAISSVAIFLAEILTFDELDIFTIQPFVGKNFFTTQIACLIPLFFLSLCVFSSLFDMKLGGLYGLYSHHTDSASLIFASLNFSRVSTPLVFNFLQMNQLINTNFNLIMGDASLAYSFVQYFPLILVVLILGQLFDVYGRLMNWIGLSRFRFSESFNDERIEEGRVILARAHKEKSGTTKDRSYSYKAPNEGSDYSIETKLLAGRSYYDISDSDNSMGRSRTRTQVESPERSERSERRSTTRSRGPYQL